MSKIVLQQTADEQWKYRVYEDGEIKHQSDKFKNRYEARKEYEAKFGTYFAVEIKFF
ncbi:MAG: hypothetical protein PHW29_04395 [Flavobacterium sp.]|nr:hypothetical protein [Flavobacterium sp.]